MLNPFHCLLCRKGAEKRCLRCGKWFCTKYAKEFLEDCYLLVLDQLRR